MGLLASIGVGLFFGFVAVCLLRKTAFQNTHPFEYKMDWVIMFGIALFMVFITQPPLLATIVRMSFSSFSATAIR